VVLLAVYCEDSFYSPRVTLNLLCDQVILLFARHCRHANADNLPGSQSMRHSPPRAFRMNMGGANDVPVRLVCPLCTVSAIAHPASFTFGQNPSVLCLSGLSTSAYDSMRQTGNLLRSCGLNSRKTNSKQAGNLRLLGWQFQ
jgi:hypothetical protein